jgi:hypothetical protein
MSNPTDESSMLADLAVRLGMAECAGERLRQMPVATDLELADDVTAREQLEFSSVLAGDLEAMLAARPDPEQHPDWWTLLRATVGELRQRMDRPVEATGYVAWPTVSPTAGPIGMFLYAWALLTVLPDLVELHRRRGIPEAVSRDSASRLGGVMFSHREVTGEPGVGLFPLWGPPQYFCGADYLLGRHSFTRAELALGDGVAGHVLQVHVPPAGPLDQAASEKSLARAEHFFPDHYPEQPISAFVCKSWLLDPQLTHYLSPDSNIVRFQRRFRLLPHVPLDDDSEGDREMMRLGLHVTPPSESTLSDADLERIPQTTTLQRAFVTHLRAGKHWHKRTGIRRMHR